MVMLWQWFAADEDFKLAKHDRPTPKHQQSAAIAAFLETAIRDRFTLYDAPLFRADLLVLSPLDCLLALRLHHIAADGVALALLVPQIAAFYTGERQEQRPDFAYERWLDRGGEQASSNGLGAALAFYTKEFQGAKQCHEALYDQPDGLPCYDPPQLPEASHTLETEACEALRALARANAATLFIVLLAAYSAVLRQAVCASDLVVATFVSGRAGERDPLVGTCINTVLVRLKLESHTTAAELIAAAKAGWRPVRQHQAVPFMLLSRAAAGSLPEAQFAINYLDMAEAPFDLPGVAGAVTHAEQGFPLNDLLLYALREQDGRLRLRLIVGSGTARLSRSRVSILLGNLVRLLQSWLPENKSIDTK